MADRKNRFALISKFEKKCRDQGLSVSTLNKHKEQWAADDLLESYDDPDLNSAMDYYFSINPRPTWKGYCQNVDRLLFSMKAKKADQEFRADMRQKAKEWLK